MAQERVLGFNDLGEEKWHEGNRLPEGWHKQDPTKGQKAGDKIEEPVQVDPKGTIYPEVEDNGPQDDPPAEPAVIERGNFAPEAEPKPEPAPEPEPKPKAKKKAVELDADGDEPMPTATPETETPKRKPGRPKRGD